VSDVTDPDDKVERVWNAMREAERKERDARIAEDLDQADRISRTLSEGNE
jgi:hypothetical protein